MVSMVGEQLLARQVTGAELPRSGNRDSSRAPHGCYRCAGDDSWLTLACENDVEFAALCRVIGRPALATDERFGDVVSRFRNQAALDAIIAAWTAQQAAAEAAETLQAAGVPAMTVLSVQDVFADAHLRARGFFELVSHPVAGVWEIDGPHWRMSETPAHVRLPAPAFAQHTDYVLCTLLGLTDDEVASLEADGITGRQIDASVHE